MSEFFAVKTAAARARLQTQRNATEFVASTTLREAAEMMTLLARSTQKWKDRTFETRKSMRAPQVISAFHLRFVAGGASRWLDEGTKAHGPVTAPYLRFKGANGWVTTKWVRGITATNFIRDARDVADRFIHETVTRRLVQAYTR